MNIVLTVNEQSQAMLLHDGPLGFTPSWVEFSRDARGVRIISDAGREFSAGVLINLVAWNQLDNVSDVLLVYMKDSAPVEGYVVPFVNQTYQQAA